MSNMIGMIAFIYVMVAFYTDIRWMIIPNRLTLSAAGLGITIQTVVYHWTGLITSVMGLSVAFVLTLGLYLIRGVGAGDVKGLAALGAITGAQFTVSVLIIALIYAGVVGLLIVVFRGRISGLILHWWISIICYCTTREREHLRLIATHRVHSFPFMIAVMPAFMTCLITI
ncbi:MAG: A24 family peptidase [Paenibacillaceae bacterium]